MKKYIFFSILITLFLIFVVFLKYGRSYYMPVYQKVKGMETVESILDKLEGDVFSRLKLNLQNAGFSEFPKELLIIAFKKERLLEVYGFNNSKPKLIKKYPFLGYSGKLGPKIKEGDKQIPEGIYKIEYLNPNSSYYLSLKINYPNEFDVSKSQFDDIKNMGGDIFIHGKSHTIGCIPVGDDAIEEIFVMVQKAFDKDVKVIISPQDLRTNKIYPDIRSIDWESELYDKIKTELNLYFNN
ncbi:MAG: L,D-transpeptidase family protein [Candidatus Kapabacteria bacterium]|nr:L,D-transpeptidase family protein [Ignavibacteriota bacterium]MCW5886097.1 L,D-transpeptidase family protein [Candidatus Kapabacteria bacterium]